MVLAVRTEDVAPDLTREFADLSPDMARQAADRVVRGYEQWMNSFRQHSQAALIVHSLEHPTHPSFGVLDSQSEGGQSETGQSGLIRQINRELRRVAKNHRGIYILDYDALVARYGSKHWHDERKWLTARLPIARIGEPTEVAEAYLYLMRAGYTTGQVLLVDGGGSVV